MALVQDAQRKDLSSDCVRVSARKRATHPMPSTTAVGIHCRRWRQRMWVLLVRMHGYGMCGGSVLVAPQCRRVAMALIYKQVRLEICPRAIVATIIAIGTTAITTAM